MCPRLLVALFAVAPTLAVACGGASGDAPPLSSARDGGAFDDGSTVVDGAAPSDGATPADADADADATSPCPIGTTLAARVTCSAQPLAAPAQLALDLAQASPGDVISLSGLAEGTAPCLPVVTCTPDDAPDLLFSDDPESPQADGVLYADTIAPGRLHRIYVYHANNGVAARKFPVVVLNQGAADATVTIRRRGVGGPSKAYVTVGKDVLAAWSQTIAPVVVTVPAGQRVLLDAALDAIHAGQDDLVHAIYDVDVSAPVKVSVVSVLSGADAAATTGGLSLLARDASHVRGTFPGADLLVVAAEPKSGVQHLRLGVNEVDRDLEGTDAPLGTKVKLAGNYGVRYRLALGLAAPTPAAISPRGGAWGGVASLPAITKLPAAAESTSTSAIALGAVGALGAPEIALLSAGGSNLPVDLFLVTP